MYPAAPSSDAGTSDPPPASAAETLSRACVDAGRPPGPADPGDVARVRAFFAARGNEPATMLDVCTSTGVTRVYDALAGAPDVFECVRGLDARGASLWRLRDPRPEGAK